jgi:hypothetical protein
MISVLLTSNGAQVDAKENTTSKQLPLVSDLTASAIRFDSSQNISNNPSTESSVTQIIALGNNAFLAWYDALDGGVGDVFFAKSSDSGRTFDDMINVSNTPTQSGGPTMAVAGDSIYIIWVEYNEQDRPELFFSRSGDLGSSFSVPVKLSGEQSVYQDFSHLAVGEGGSVYVAWTDFDSIQVHFTRSTNSGETFEPEQILSNEGEYSQLYEMLAVDDNIYFFWETFEPEFHFDFVRSNDGGATFDSPVQLIADGNFPSPDGDIIASGDNIYWAWSGYSEDTGAFTLEFLKSNDGGDTFELETLLNKVDFDRPAPKLAASGDSVYLIWNQAPESRYGSNDVMFMKSVDAGQTFGVPIDISNSIHVSYDEGIYVVGSNIYVAWIDRILGKDDVFFRASLDEGKTFGDITKLNPSDSGESVRPLLAGSDNDVYIAWSSNIDTVYRDVFLIHGALAAEQNYDLQRSFVLTETGASTIKGKTDAIDGYLFLEIRGDYGCDEDTVTGSNMNSFTPDEGSISGTLTVYEHFINPNPDDEEDDDLIVTTKTIPLSDITIASQVKGKEMRLKISAQSEQGDNVKGTIRLPEILACDLASGSISTSKSNSLSAELDEEETRHQARGVTGNLFAYVDLG